MGTEQWSVRKDGLAVATTTLRWAGITPPCQQYGRSNTNTLNEGIFPGGRNQRVVGRNNKHNNCDGVLARDAIRDHALFQ